MLAPYRRGALFFLHRGQKRGDGQAQERSAPATKTHNVSLRSLIWSVPI